MNFFKLRMGVCLLLIATLAGCGRLVSWGQKTFYQGEPVKQCTQGVTNYMRSLYLYDQFSTVCTFDVLWLSDAVRTAYACAHTVKTGKGEDFRINFLRRQLKENEHFITFYMLSIDPKLAEKDTTWSLSLQVNDQNYTPVSIKIIDLTQEYVLFFGKKYTSFKTAYEVKFNAFTKEEKPILDKHITTMSLHVRSLLKQAMLTWDIYPVQDKNCLG